MEYYNKFEHKTTLADGSCFYSALYRSARDTSPRLLQKIYMIFDLNYKKGGNDIQKEKAFINGVSSAVITAIRDCVYIGFTQSDGKGKMDETIFKSFYNESSNNTVLKKEEETDEDFEKRKKRIANTRASSRNTSFYTGWRDEAARELQDKFPSDETQFKNTYPNTKEGETQFYNDVAGVLELRIQHFVYASMIDIDVVTHILLYNNIKLMRVSNITDIRKEHEDNMPTLWLHREDEHYNYYIKKPLRSPRSKSHVKQAPPKAVEPTTEATKATTAVPIGATTVPTGATTAKTGATTGATGVTTGATAATTPLPTALVSAPPPPEVQPPSPPPPPEVQPPP